MKLPQEYWIHVAQRDVTDTLRDHAWAPLAARRPAALAVVVWFVVLPRTPEPDHPLRLAADPLPEEMDTAAEQAAWRAGSSRLWSLLTLEKVVLVGLLSVIFSQSLPGLHVSKVELFVGVAVLIVVNTAIVIAAARRQVSFESLLVTFLVRIAVNVALVLVARIVLGPNDLNVGHTLFFVLLLSLLTSMHDRYQPVYVARVVRERQGTSTCRPHRWRRRPRRRRPRRAGVRGARRRSGPSAACASTDVRASARCSGRERVVGVAEDVEATGCAATAEEKVAASPAEPPRLTSRPRGREHPQRGRRPPPERPGRPRRRPGRPTRARSSAAVSAVDVVGSCSATTASAPAARRARSTPPGAAHGRPPGRRPAAGPLRSPT